MRREAIRAIGALGPGVGGTFEPVALEPGIRDGEGHRRGPRTPVSLCHVGIAFRVLWVGAPRWLYTPCYLALGWAPVRYLPEFMHSGGVAVACLIVTGGLLYSAGAVVYALQRPDPSPCWFGFHEVFHTLTVAAFTAHYIAIFLAAS